MGDLYVSWSEYHHHIEVLAAKIYQSGWHFNQILALARGGVRIGDLLSRIYRQPLAILAASSYEGPEDQHRGTLTLAPTLTMTTATLGDRILVVDDLVDSGTTLAQALTWLEQQYGLERQHTRTAVLWHKAHSRFIPDYAVDYLADNPWIHQPFEHYDQMTPAGLAAQFCGPSSHASSGKQLA